MIDIANVLSGNGYDITLVSGCLVVRNNPLSGSVKFKKIFKYNRSNNLWRLLSWIIGFLQIIYILKTKYRKDYLLLVSNPPFNTFLPLLCNNRFSMMIFDVYPDTLNELGLNAKNSIIVRLWQKANKIVFSHADNIFTLSEGMSHVLSKYKSVNNISVIPVWSDNNFVKPIEKEQNPFIARHNLGEKFVLLYSGNLGTTHNVELLPELAGSVQDPNVVFLIIGEGDRRKWIESEIHARKLKNCLLLPLQPVSILPYSFACADLAIVSQSPRASGFSVPSKVFNYMSAGLPLLCITGNNSELLRLIAKYDNGRCFLPDQIKEIASFVERLKVDKQLLEHFRINSLKASGDFTPYNAEIIGKSIIKSSGSF